MLFGDNSLLMQDRQW